MDWTFAYMWCYFDRPPLKENKMGNLFDPNLRDEDDYIEKNRASENLNINNLKNRKMKTKPGTAKPSGAGVGKGGPKTSPTDGRSLKPSGKGTSKGGKKK